MSETSNTVLLFFFAFLSEGRVVHRTMRGTHNNRFVLLKNKQLIKGGRRGSSCGCGRGTYLAQQQSARTSGRLASVQASNFAASLPDTRSSLLESKRAFKRLRSCVQVCLVPMYVVCIFHFLAPAFSREQRKQSPSRGSRASAGSGDV